MLPGAPRALELLLAESELQASGADSQGAGPEYEGASLWGVGPTGWPGLTPGLLVDSWSPGGGHRTLQDLVSRLVWGPRCKVQGPGPQKSGSQWGQAGGEITEPCDGARTPPRGVRRAPHREGSHPCGSSDTLQPVPFSVLGTGGVGRGRRGRWWWWFLQPSPCPTAAQVW